MLIGRYGICQAYVQGDPLSSWISEIKLPEKIPENGVEAVGLVGEEDFLTDSEEEV